MDNQSDDDWTIPSTIGTESFVTEGMMDFKVLGLSVAPRHDAIGSDSSMTTTQVCVTLKATDIPDDDDDEKRAAVDIVIALDVSTSMTGKKLDLCKKTLELLLRHLSSKDRFGLILYGDTAKICIPTSLATPAMKQAALEKIKAIRPSGCTNLSGGLTLAAQEMMAIDGPNQVRSIFLLTDGHANEGIIDTPSLVKIVKNFTSSNPSPPTDSFQNIALEGESAAGGAATLESTEVAASDGASTNTKPKTILVDSSPPISLHCFGYGADHKSDMLQEMADASPGGTYYFVESDSNVLSAFGDAMGGILSVVAQSAVLSITVPLSAAAKGVSIVNVHHEEAIKRENGSYTVTVGDFYAEESRDVLFELTLASGWGTSAPVPHAIVNLSYTDTVQKTVCTAGPLVCAIARPPGADVSEGNPYVETQWLRVHVVREMQAADREAQSNQLAAAQTRLSTLMGLIASSAPAVRQAPLTVNLLTDIRTVATGFQSRATYHTSGAHAVKRATMCQAQQRCNASAPSTVNIYRTKKKSKLAKDWGA